MSEPPLTMFGEMERWQKAYSKESAMALALIGEDGEEGK